MCRPSPSYFGLLVHHPCSTRRGFASSSRRAQENCTLWLALLAHGCYNLLSPTRKEKIQKQEYKAEFIDITNTPKQYAKLQDFKPKLTRVRFASLKKSSFFFCKNQKQNKKRIFWSALASLPLSLWHTGIMYSCIFRRRLAGWWLVIYTCKSARFQFSYWGGSSPLVLLQLSWLQFSIGRLPF